MDDRVLYQLRVDGFGRFTFTHPSGTPVERYEAQGIVEELIRQYPQQGFLSYEIALRDAHDPRAWTFANEPQRLGHGVYFFKAEQFPGEVKIGVATSDGSYERRLGGLRSKFGEGHFIAFIECQNTYALEQAIHHWFHDYFKHGEFYEAEPVFDWIEEITGRTLPSDDDIHEYNRRCKVQRQIDRQEQLLVNAQKRLTATKYQKVIDEQTTWIATLNGRIALLKAELERAGT